MYKQSNYNYFVQDGDKVVYLNGITSKMFAMSQAEHAKMQILLQDLEKFQVEYPTTFKYFEKQGFITTDDVDEISILLYRNRQAVFTDKNYMLIINPTLECNFRCWYLFFDEATNALDASNEREVMQHMNCFFQGRTVVVIAHRLSTVCNADKIIVLKKGHIVEEGKHDELIRLKGFYYNLVKDQLVLG